MPIDFHQESNANTYASRRADDSWFVEIHAILTGGSPRRVADIGCGGGIYSRAWRELGAESVIGVDYSAQMIADARAATIDDAISYRVGSADDTGLESDSCDVVFCRAVIHHLDDYVSAMREAYRILAPGGLLIVQDRTIEDVLQPISATHIRAHFFAAFPKLLQEERRRRPETAAFVSVIASIGFIQQEVHTMWETRRVYVGSDELRSDLLSRTGRSILHELRDDELASLADVMVQASRDQFPLREEDRWTMWTALKPGE